MNLGDHAPIPRPHFRPTSGQRGDEASDPELAEALSTAIASTSDWLLARQHSSGYWCGELEGDTILESEYILLLAWLRQEETPLAKKAANYLLEKQLPGGGWAMYPGGPLEISGSVKAYFALKLTGHDPDADYMRRARQAIRAAGGADAVNSFTRFYLALLGQISYDHCPAVPPELILLPKWSPINIYRMSAWSRTIVVPLAIMWAHRPRRALRPAQGIWELFLKEPEHWPHNRCVGLADETGRFSWDRFFRQADATLKWLEKRRWLPLRQRALRGCTEWMTTRFAHSDGLGAIFPPIVWSIIALKCLGYADDSAEVQYNFDQLRALTIEERDSARLQPCLSPVWDTTLAMRALAGAGLSPRHPAIATATDWLLDKEVTRAGDWAETVNVAPGGWFFEHHNDFYPDVDDTAMALIALAEARVRETASADAKAADSRPAESRPADGRSGDKRAAPRAARALAASLSRARGAHAAGERARRWMLAMQNRDGGWGAFDRNNDSQFLCHVPFADHNAMIDPSTPDLTGRAIEALMLWGARSTDQPIQRGIAYLRGTQERDGSWFGRWGVNYIYGTWQSLVGLAAAGIPASDPALRRGANWLLACQHACGGWGESAASYDQPELRGQGAVTPSQTAWAILGLLAAGQRTNPAVQRGIRYLLDTQNPDGGWDEAEFTGTGFPRVFYLRYHYYRIYFPLLALAKFQAAERGSEAHSNESLFLTSPSPQP
ncbi:MAG: prenyltransferase/squalene oxidase repeat-containing protein [Pirellulaceae bacterium]|nr:prenyltransferase/squalene oxidase repeat-containing protein [Pirellulaceae bacterium]